jgi:molybdopterin converting factor small subunit
MPRIMLPLSLAGRFTGGCTDLDVSARSFGRLVRELDARYPGLGTQVEAGMAIAIDGVIFQDTYAAELPEAGEICLIPRIAGG